MNNFLKFIFGKFFWIKYSSDLCYKGSWKQGRFNGKGILKYKNGNVYEGSFKNGAKNGFGRLISIKGYEYHGNWICGKQTGECQVYYKNGDIYSGSFLNGMRQGYGELFTNNNFRNYKGYWDKDTINGEVSITSEDWSFKGHYNHFNLHAEGQLIYKDQSSYLGSLIDFKKKGNGTYSLASGEQINGYWTNDYDVINATKKDKNGFIWKGAFKNLKPNGLIKVELPSSQSYDGIWSNGVMQRAVGAFGIKLRPLIIN